MAEFGLGKSVQTCMKFKEKCYLMKHTSMKVISIGNLYFVPRLDDNEIWTKKMGEFGLGQSIRNCMKIKEQFYLMKLTSMRVISIGNLLFFPKIR